MRKTEKEIQEILGSNLNNTLNHRMNYKDTTSTIFPTAGVWCGKYFYKTINESNQPSEFMDPGLNKLHHIKMNQFKKFDEEMMKAKNMMKKTKNDKGDKKEEKTK